MASKTDKDELLKKLKAHLEADLDAITEGQLASQAGATHAENKAEGDKDMRATESSYLARGLAKRVQELREAVSKLSSMNNRSFSETSLIAMSALVSVEDDDGNVLHYYIAPCGGGIALEQSGRKYSVVTTGSPLGQSLLGRHVDDEVELQTPQGPRFLTVTDLS